MTELTAAEIQIVNMVVHRYLAGNESTPRKMLVLQAKSPDAVEKLARWSVIRTNDQKEYLPSVLSFHYCEDSEAQVFAKQSVETVAAVLKELYAHHPGGDDKFTPSEIEEHAREMGLAADTNTIRRGLYLGTEFNLFVRWGGNPLDITYIGISERIVEIDRPETLWDEFIHRNTGWIQKQIKSAPGEVHNERDDMTAEVGNPVLVLISHSSKDPELAGALVELFKAALGLLSPQIRCTSVDGYRLPVGVNTEARLREEVNSAKVVIGLITLSSLSSSYVMFELGARWGAQRFLAPLLAGVSPDQLRGPLSLLNSLSLSNEAQIHQLLENVAEQLGIQLQNASSYFRYVAEVKKISDSLRTLASEKPSDLAMQSAEAKVSIAADGIPPAQFLNVKGTKPLRISRIEYMLSDESCIVAEDVSLEGAEVEVPLSQECLTKLMNIPRSDRNNFDGSGPVKLGIDVGIDGQSQRCVLPVHLDNHISNTGSSSTYFRRVTGSKTYSFR